MRFKKTTFRSYFLSSLLVFLILFSEITPFIYKSLSSNILPINDSKDNPYIGAYNPDFPEYLYLSNVEQIIYNFNAKDESYILAEVNGIDFSYFELDGEIYNVSYGINIFSKDFGEDFDSHTITFQQADVDNENFKWFCIEPLFLAEGNIEVNLTDYYEAKFEAGGSISLLIQPNFSYNYLYLEVLELETESIVMKNIFEPNGDIPEIQSQFYSYLVKGGAFTRFDINLKPGIHKMRILGDGSINYKIMVNFDWDDDSIHDVDEVQKQLFKDINPVLPDIWGFYERGNTIAINEQDETIGVFTFYVPESYTGLRYLSIDVHSGKFWEFQINEDTLTLKDIEITVEPFTNSISQPYGIVSSGWHNIQYKFNSSLYPANITFRVDYKPIVIMEAPEFSDLDSDGLKDTQEWSSGLKSNSFDCDNDGLPDSMDSSPLACLSLNKDLMHQIVIPHNPDKNTILTMTIKKPENDYSTYDSSRVWMQDYEYGGGLEVFIQPVMRLFGNSTIQRDDLVSFWKDDSSNVETFSLLEGDFSGVGDAIPHEDNPNAEFMFFYPKPSEEVYEFDIIFEKDHPAKDDNVIDLRFDFVWLVSSPNATGNMQVIHYYEIDEDIILQSLVSREVDNVNYILGSPDSMTENQILWNLVQNPQLGLPSDFNVADDVVGMGTVDYFDLANQTLEIRETQPLLCDINGNPLETEVLYVSGLQSNYDLLNKICIKMNNSLTSFETNHSGDYEAFYSFYSVSNVYAEDLYTIEDEEIRGENRVCYITTWNNYSEGLNNRYEQRTNIQGFPIYMKIIEYGDTKILEITDAIGDEIPLNQIPLDIGDILHDKIILHNVTYIEIVETLEGIPLISFNETRDIYKEFFDSRSHEVVKGDMFFKRYSLMDARIFEKLINRVINVLNNLISDCELIIAFYDYAKFYDLPIQAIDPRMAKWNRYMEAFNRHLDVWKNNLEYIDDLDIDKLLNDLEGVTDDIWNPRFDLRLLSEEQVSGELIEKIFTEMCSETDDHFSEYIKTSQEFNTKLDQLKENADPFGRLRCWFKKHQINSKISLGAVGAVTIVAGVVMFTYGLLETFKLISEFEDGGFSGRELEFAVRLTQSIGTTVLGGIMLTYGVLIFLGPVSNFKYISQNAFTWAAKWLPRVMTVITIIIAVFDIAGQLIQAWETYGFSTEFALEVIEITIKAGLQYLIPIILMATGHTGWGIVVGILAAIGIYIWDWLTGANQEIVETYEPSIEIIGEENGVKQTYFIFPTSLIKKHGSLEIGDQVGLRLKINNSGDCVSYFQAKFAAGGSDFTEYQGNWIDGYNPLDTDVLEFTRILPNMAPNLIAILNLSIESNVPSRTRIYDTEDLIWINIPIMSHNIDNFYAQTVPLSKPYDHEKLIELYERAMKNYEYKHASDYLENLRFRIANDFLEDIDGNVPNGWEDISSAYGTSFVEVHPNKENHYKVVRLFQDEDGYRSHIRTLINKVPNGTMEFWVYHDGGGSDLHLILHDANSIYHEKIEIKFGWDHHIYYLAPNIDVETYYTMIKEYCFYPNTWYNIRIDFEFGSNNYCDLNEGTFNLWMNGVKIGSGLPVRRSGNGIKYIEFHTDWVRELYPGDLTSNNFIDAIDYSWSDGYYFGRSYNWDYTLDEINEYQVLYNALDIRTNINSNLNEDILEIDPSIGWLMTDFNLDLDGPGDIMVDYEFLVDDSLFNIESPTLTQFLEDSIIVNISTNNPNQFGGIYFFHMNIKLYTSGELIYKETIPFRIPFVKDFQYNQFQKVKFAETFDSEIWSLYDVADTVIHTDNIVTDDAYVSNYYPNSNYGDYDYLRIWYEWGDIKKEAYIKWEYPYLSLNSTAPSSLYCYFSSYGSDNLNIYNTFDFDETTITWNNKPSAVNLLNTVDPHSNGWKEIVLGDPFYYYKLCLDYSEYGDFQIQSSECDGLEPRLRHHFSKYYHGDGLIYMQSDVDELLNLKSPIYPSTTNLELGDLIEIECKSTTSNEIVLVLINNGEIVKNYTVIPRGNINYESQKVRIPVLESISFDQLMFSGYSQGGYFEANDITIVNHQLPSGQPINPMNFTNYGNIPEFVKYEYNGGISDRQDLFEFKFEVGEVELDQTIDKAYTAPITFQNTYNEPVVVAYIRSRGGGQSVEVRVKDITSNGCEIFMEENDNEGHNNEWVDYIVMEKGKWELPDGLKVEAGTVFTDSNHNNGEDFDGVNINFAQSFNTIPAVLYTLNSYNNGDYKASTSYDITTNSFKIQQESGRSGVATSFESIGWIAVETGKSGEVEGVKYETGSFSDGTPDGKDDSPHVISFNSFNSPPFIVVKQNSVNDPDKHGSYARGQGTHSSIQHKTYAEEDQINNGGERHHPDEIFGYWAFESGLSHISLGGVDLLENKFKEYEVVLPGEHINCLFNITVVQAESNLLYRQVIAKHPGTLETFVNYQEIFGIEGIYLESPISRIYNIYGLKSNRKNDIRLDYVSEVSLDWCAYSFDNNPNITMTENNYNSIPIPETGGLHSIQLFGKDSSNSLFKSEKKFFIINYPIKIFKPLNITYELRAPVNCSFGSIVYFEEYSYSLDDQEKILITSDNRFELPKLDNSIHSLIIFGKDSYNHEYQSEKLYFSIDSPIIWEENFETFESYMTHNFYPDDFESIFSMNPLYMKNKFPELTSQEDWGNWNLQYDSNYITSSFNNGIFNSQLLSGASTYIPAQSGDFSIIKGTSNWLGNLESRDNDFTTFTSTELPPNIQYIDWISYTYGHSGSGTIENTYYDNSAYKQINSEWNKMLQANILGIELKFNPALSGRSFRLNIDAVTSGGYTGQLKVNGQVIRSGSVIDENNIIIENVNNIKFYVLEAAETSFNVKIYYFKLEVLNPNPNYIDSVSYDFGNFQGGSLTNTHNDDSYYYSMRPQKTFDMYYLDANFNFDPSLNGQDFILHVDIRSSGVDGACLRVNGQPIRTGTIINENNIILENVQSISYDAERWLYSFTTYIYYFKLIPLNMVPDLEFDCNINLGNSHPEDTLQNMELHYSYKTDQNQLVYLKMWNYGTTNWDILDNNIYTSFSDHSINIGSNYYNQNYEIKIKFEGLDDDTLFHLYIDQLVVDYDWTRTSGNIYSHLNKAISFDFLNRYDTSYPIYQKLYNITINFNYKFTASSPFSTYSTFSIDNSLFFLITDNNWHTFSYIFEFNSQDLDEFYIEFNVSNGCLELDNMNYNMKFKCLDTTGRTILQQNFLLECLNSQDLSEYSQLYLNISYNLQTFEDHIEYYNIDGSQNNLEIKFEIKADGIWKSHTYSTNSSESTINTFNITQFMIDNNLINFEDFRLTFTIIGNNTELSVFDVILFGYK